MEAVQHTVDALHSRGCSLKKVLVHPEKKSEKSEKNPKNPKIFLRIYNPYNLFGSEQLLEFSV